MMGKENESPNMKIEEASNAGIDASKGIMKRSYYQLASIELLFLITQEATPYQLGWALGPPYVPVIQHPNLVAIVQSHNWAFFFYGLGKNFRFPVC